MNLTHPTPRQLAVPAAVIGAASLTFALLADSATEGDGAARLDPRVATGILDLRMSVLTGLARALSLIGSELVVGVTALALMIVLLERRGPKHAGLAAGAMAVSAGLTVAVKMGVGRPRPGAVDRLGAFDGSYSFPSGHTLNSAVLLGLVCLLLVPVFNRRSTRVATYAVAAALAIGIGASRVYLGYHWTTDVIASWLIATVLLTIVHLVDRFIGPSRVQSGSSQVRRSTLDP